LNKNCLYLTFDGLSDPLGQSQILPYLTGIAKNGYRITILSCEKPGRLENAKQQLTSQLQSAGINWEYILYNEAGSFFSRFSYIRKLYKKAKTRHAITPFQLVHCRSYLTALVGLKLKQNFEIPFVFDMRGLWADERIDGNIWQLSKPHHRFFYKYFKKKEKAFLKQANAVVMLTDASLNYLNTTFPEFELPAKTTVIPCCTDVTVFKQDVDKAEVRAISESDHVIIYTGSIGTWYYTKEVIDCVLVWQELIPNIKLLIVTKDTEALKAILKNYTPQQQSLVVTTSAAYQQMPAYLKLAKATLFFIKPAFSKIASSPTKMAECWAMNLPVITNSGIGDNDFYIEQHRGGILLNEFNETAYKLAGEQYLQLMKEPLNCRNIALDHFNKERAVEKYTAIYRRLIKEQP
jgi:glycosyltransferase involved in cell wall biosynthesis